MLSIDDLIKLLGESLHSSTASRILIQLGEPSRVYGDSKDGGNRFLEFAKLGIGISYYGKQDVYATLHFHVASRMVKDGHMCAYEGELPAGIRTNDLPFQVRAKLACIPIFETVPDKDIHATCQSLACENNQPYWQKFLIPPYQFSLHYSSSPRQMKSFSIHWMPKAQIPQGS